MIVTEWHTEFPPRPGHWNVLVTFVGVTGSAAAYRWRWRTRLHARSFRRFWPDPKAVRVVWVPADWTAE